MKEYIKKIYDESEGRYGSPKIHKQLMEIYNLKVSEKRVQRLMREMDLYSVIVKKYKYHSSKNAVEGLENILKKNFTTTTINENWLVIIH